ncbi:MAG: hypothetical protein HUU32_04195 [Calditrichaceae bacterium]|nr:hypothetical protein [Calditrichia bacterium]NUQ40579.1 hypothetical protein [Calditrichaceae bacterium]
MADNQKDDRTQNQKKEAKNSKTNADQEELKGILEQISETSETRKDTPPAKTEPATAIKKPEGPAGQANEIEEILEKIAEKPAGKARRGMSFLQRLLNFFKKS